MKEAGYHAVSLYCDDKGIAKGLEPNMRATGLVHACGYTDQTIRGDAFISRMCAGQPHASEGARYRTGCELQVIRPDLPPVSNSAMCRRA